MRKLLFLVIAFAIIVSSCKRKPKPLEEEINDPFKLEYSKLTTEQHKQELEASGIDFVNKISTLPDQKFIDVLSHLSDLSLTVESSSVSSVLAIGKAANKKDLKGIFGATTTAVDTSAKLSELYGIYTWNPSTGEWEESASSSKLEIRFPSHDTVATNNTVLTFSYVASNVKATIDGELVELPASVTGVLKVDNKVELSYTSSYVYKSDGTPTKAESNLVLGAFSLKTSVVNTSSNLTSSLSFLKGTEVLISLNTSFDGNVSVTNANNAETIEEVVANANATFDIMNIRLAGRIDIKALSEADKASENLSDSLRSIKEADAWNKYTQFAAINKTNNTIIAKTDFVPVSDKDCYSVWGQGGSMTHCETYYYLEPRLIFKDDSKVGFESFIDEGFSQLIEELDEFGEAFK